LKLRLAALATIIMLSACRHAGDLTAENGGGIYQIRGHCPTLGLPAGTGDITLFNPPESRDSRAIDVTATISDLRGNCVDSGDDVVSTATFTVVGLRRDPGPARQVILPYFDTAVQGGSRVVAKQIGQIALDFPAGSLHASTRAQASIRVNRSVASLPASVVQILTRPRKAGDADAAVDPLSDPSVRTAVADSTFEHLIGFQMGEDQLRYNVTR
jgi:hypothetical protein